MIDVSNKINCCGCSACANICKRKAITMQPDAMGFLYPVVDSSLCNNCNACDNVCQFKDVYNRYVNFDEPVVYGCRHKDIKELLLSQSGAASWAIIQSFFSKPGVVYGVGYETPTHIIHKRATSLNECREFRGSKYVQSDIRGVFHKVKKDLQDGERVLFFGTACQIAGLKSFVAGSLQDKLFTVDVVCHSTPAPAVWKSYIGYYERKKNKNIIKVDFRDPSFGWHSHIESFTFSDGTKKSDCIFGELFYNHMIIRPSCSNCHYTNFNRVSDVTISDFWGWETHYKEWNDNKGVSLFLVNSAKGEQIKSLSEKHLNFIESDKSKCLQPQLQEPAKLHPEYDAIVSLFEKKGFEGVARKYGYIPGYKYYKDKFLPYFYAGKHKIAKLIGLSK